ncbi:hypothetical protein AYX14_07152 [Cryptococcus neoformans]|nr:hypothetical protein AYX14_07152 [Cryptococcus neoformans var. grubii]
MITIAVKNSCLPSVLTVVTLSISKMLQQ